MQMLMFLHTFFHYHIYGLAMALVWAFDIKAIVKIGYFDFVYLTDLWHSVEF